MINLIYCKNFCKCNNVPPSSTTIKKKNKNGGRVSQRKPLSDPVPGGPFGGKWEALKECLDGLKGKTK
jgi:hypothetical protein